MFGVSASGLIGTTGFLNPIGMNLAVYESLSPAVFIIFQTVFAAMAATIVSGAMAERTNLLVVQMIGVAVVALWTLSSCAILFFVFKKTVGLRVGKEEEKLGLDQSEHGMTSYPDFMIK